MSRLSKRLGLSKNKRQRLSKNKYPLTVQELKNSWIESGYLKELDLTEEEEKDKFYPLLKSVK